MPLLSRRQALVGGLGLGLAQVGLRPERTRADVNGDVIQPVEAPQMAADVVFRLLGSTPLVVDLFPRECTDLVITAIEAPDGSPTYGLLGTFMVTEGSIGHDPDDAICGFRAFSTQSDMEKTFEFAMASSDKNQPLELLGHTGAQLGSDAGESQLVVKAGTLLVIAMGKTRKPNGAAPTTPGEYLIEPSPPRTMAYLAGALHHLDRLAIEATSGAATPAP